MEVSSKATRTFAALNNSPTYANPIILYGSKIPSASERSSIPAGTLSLRRRRTLRDGTSAVSAVCNCACIIARVKPEINLKTILSNTQHFAVYVRCMPSRRLRRLDTPLVYLMLMTSLHVMRSPTSPTVSWRTVVHHM